MTCAILCCTHEATETVRVTSRTISPADERIVVRTQAVAVCTECASKLRQAEVRDELDMALCRRACPDSIAHGYGVDTLQDGHRENEEVTEVSLLKEKENIEAYVAAVLTAHMSGDTEAVKEGLQIIEDFLVGLQKASRKPLKMIIDLLPDGDIDAMESIEARADAFAEAWGG